MKFKAGKYFIGDLSYVLPRKDWMKLCEGLFSRGDEDTGFKIRGRDVFVAGTAYGDGEYKDADGNMYSVDTGTLGIAPLELCNQKYIKDIIENGGGQIESFARAFEVSASGGRFQFGHVLIATDGSDDEEADECNCNCCPH